MVLNRMTRAPGRKLKSLGRIVMIMRGVRSIAQNASDKRRFKGWYRQRHTRRFR